MKAQSVQVEASIYRNGIRLIGEWVSVQLSHEGKDILRIKVFPEGENPAELRVRLYAPEEETVQQKIPKSS